MTIVEEFEKMNDALTRMRIFATFMAKESEKRERAFEIINTVEDVIVDIIKSTLEMENLTKEFCHIVEEYVKK